MQRNACTPPSPMTENFEFAPWKLTTRKSHILPSNCAASCSKAQVPDACLICRYQRNLTLPHLPDMVFPDNILRIENSEGSGLEFNALDALKLVNDKEDLIKVAVAEAWKEARAEVDGAHKVSHPFDWTFTSDYRGTLLGSIKAVETDLRIDMEKLKQKERILFFDEIHLYEDELADHGCTSCSVKVVIHFYSFYFGNTFLLIYT